MEEKIEPREKVRSVKDPSGNVNAHQLQRGSKGGQRRSKQAATTRLPHVESDGLADIVRTNAHDREEHPPDPEPATRGGSENGSVRARSAERTPRATSPSADPTQEAEDQVAPVRKCLVGRGAGLRAWGRDPSRRVPVIAKTKSDLASPALRLRLRLTSSISANPPCPHGPRGKKVLTMTSFGGRRWIARRLK